MNSCARGKLNAEEPWESVFVRLVMTVVIAVREKINVPLKDNAVFGTQTRLQNNALVMLGTYRANYNFEHGMRRFLRPKQCYIILS